MGTCSHKVTLLYEIVHTEDVVIALIAAPVGGWGEAVASAVEGDSGINFSKEKKEGRPKDVAALSQRTNSRHKRLLFFAGNKNEVSLLPEKQEGNHLLGV